MTLSLVAVFLPILFMGGMMGRLFREFAVTLSVAILVSLVVSLTTTPMMCARVLKSGTGPDAWMVVPAQRAVFRTACVAGMRRSLAWVLRHPRSMLAVTLATMALSVYLYTIVPKGFFPATGYGPHVREYSGRAGHFVSGHAPEADGSGGHHQERSRRLRRSRGSAGAAAAT